MPAVVLRESSGADVGFMLAAGKEPLSTVGSRDVIFMALPFPSESSLARFIKENKNTEFTAEVSRLDSTTLYSFSTFTGLAVNLNLTDDGGGTWSVQGVGSGTCASA